MLATVYMAADPASEAEPGEQEELGRRQGSGQTSKEYNGRDSKSFREKALHSELGGEGQVVRGYTVWAYIAMSEAVAQQPMQEQLRRICDSHKFKSLELKRRGLWACARTPEESYKLMTANPKSLYARAKIGYHGACWQ